VLPCELPQLRLLRDYADTKGFTIAHEFTDVETARESGRTKLGEMVTYLKKHPGACRTILVEKTDRLYRNIKDYAIVDELDVDVHLVKENEVISRSSKSSEQFVHGIKVLMARNYSLNLGEETIKGMTEKARAGIYPSNAPVGYLNSLGPAGKRIIITDPDTAPTITLLFELFASGKYSIRDLVSQLNREGVNLRGQRIHTSGAHQILRKRIYTGDFDFNGATYLGSHEPLVNRETWERVQTLLNARAENKTRKVKHDFAYTGLVRCGHCGCLMVGELKKRQYVYYHCTGNRGKCPEPYTREEVLTTTFADILRELVIPAPILAWMAEAVLESDRTEQAARQQSLTRLKSRHEQLAARIDMMYTDKLDGRITPESFDQRAAAARAEQEGIQRKILDLQKSAPAPVEEAIDIMGSISQAAGLFLEQTGAEQRRLLQVIMERAAWKGNMLETTLFEPFEIMRHSNRESRRKENKISGSGRDMEVWLPKTDIYPNTRMENSR
jgi:site-specific DNA recombinase